MLNGMIAGELNVAVSEHIIGETTRILATKFGWTPQRLEYVDQIMRTFARVVTPTEVLSVVPDDPDDNRIIECARAAGATAIITGDKDLLRLRSFEGIQIVTVSDFLSGESAR